LSNGVKFTPRGGEVRLSARLIDGSVEIMVCDTGTGISKSDLEKLGKPFEQAEGAAARTKEGTGLGLALVKSLTARHGGETQLESALGTGTTVRIRLPHAAVKPNGARAKTKADVVPFRGAA
jgi:cell cycle sensor histidine kinase DivJ